jgi:hypothetical protein
LGEKKKKYHEGKRENMEREMKGCKPTMMSPRTLLKHCGMSRFHAPSPTGLSSLRILYKESKVELPFPHQAGQEILLHLLGGQLCPGGVQLMSTSCTGLWWFPPGQKVRQAHLNGCSFS